MHEQPEPLEEPLRPAGASLDRGAHHAAESVQGPGRDLVIGMGHQSGVAHRADSGMPGQKGRHREAVGVVARHPDARVFMPRSTSQAACGSMAGPQVRSSRITSSITERVPPPRR